MDGLLVWVVWSGWTRWVSASSQLHHEPKLYRGFWHLYTIIVGLATEMVKEFL